MKDELILEKEKIEELNATLVKTKAASSFQNKMIASQKDTI